MEEAVVNVVKVDPNVVARGKTAVLGAAMEASDFSFNAGVETLALINLFLLLLYFWMPQLFVFLGQRLLQAIQITTILGSTGGIGGIVGTHGTGDSGRCMGWSLSCSRIHRF